MSEDENIEMAGLSLATPLKELRAGRNRLSVSYCDETAFQMYSHELTAGRLPEKETEIAVSSILIRMEGSEDMGMEELRQYILTCLEPYGFDDSDIAFSSSYFTTFDNASGNMLLTAAISVLILIACAAVIYSLFYISVTGKVKEYGRLRVIGMTRKQMKRLVRKESRKPSFFSIPLGIISGGIVGYLLIPGVWQDRQRMSAIRKAAVSTFLYFYMVYCHSFLFFSQ